MSFEKKFESKSKNILEELSAKDVRNINTLRDKYIKPERNIQIVSICVFVYMFVCVCVCVCVCVYEYLGVFVCVCIYCVSMYEYVRVFVRVYVCASACV